MTNFYLQMVSVMLAIYSQQQGRTLEYAVQSAVKRDSGRRVIAKVSLTLEEE